MSGYSNGGASLNNKVLKMYRPQVLSAKSDIDRNLEILRNRSGDLMMNSPIGSSAIMTSARSAIGQGLKVFPKLNCELLGIDEEYARLWSKKTIAEFGLWSRNCDYYRRNSFEDLQYIAYVTYLMQGDSFCVLRREFKETYSLKLQMIEGNRVSNPQSEGYYGYETVLANGNRIINGIEIDEEGRIEAYWISNKVPNDESGRERLTEWVRVRAYGEESGLKNVLQICNDIRAEQYRGVPYLAPVIETLKQVTRFTEAELTSAIIRTYFSVFFTGTTGGVNDVNGIMPSAYDEPVVDPSEYQLGAGTIGALPPGVNVQTVDTSKTFSTFDVFTEALIKQIGAALGIPKEVLMKTFNSSYSASRASLLQYNEEIKLRRQWFIRDFCQPIYEAFLDEAIGIGRIEAKGYEEELKRELWRQAQWYGPTMGILDPKKEIEASKMRLEVGLSTYEKEAMEMNGLTYEEIKESRK